MDLLSLKYDNNNEKNKLKETYNRNKLKYKKYNKQFKSVFKDDLQKYFCEIVGLDILKFSKLIHKPKNKDINVYIKENYDYKIIKMIKDLLN